MVIYASQKRYEETSYRCPRRQIQTYGMQRRNASEGAGELQIIEGGEAGKKV